MYAWILTLIHAVTIAGSPFAARFEEIAREIDRAAHAFPAYDGNDGVVRTAAELVAVVSFESSFDPDAVGDHGASIGLGQIGVSNLAWLNMTEEDLHDPSKNIEATAKLLRASHRTCRGWPPFQQLAAYATGRGQCNVREGVVASKHRVERGMHLLAAHPAFWTSPANVQ